MQTRLQVHPAYQDYRDFFETFESHDSPIETIIARSTRRVSKLESSPVGPLIVKEYFLDKIPLIGFLRKKREHRRVTSEAGFRLAAILQAHGIKTPTVIASKTVKRGFMATYSVQFQEFIAQSVPLDKQLEQASDDANVRLKQLGTMVAKLHKVGVFPIDCKPQNFLEVGNQLCILDLDDGWYLSGLLRVCRPFARLLDLTQCTRYLFRFGQRPFVTTFFEAYQTELQPSRLWMWLYKRVVEKRF